MDDLTREEDHPQGHGKDDEEAVPQGLPHALEEVLFPRQELPGQLGEYGLGYGYDEEPQGQLEHPVGIVQDRNGPFLQERPQHAAYEGYELVQGEPRGVG